MKKFLFVFLFFNSILCVVSCGGDDSNTSDQNPNDNLIGYYIDTRSGTIATKSDFANLNNAIQNGSLAARIMTGYSGRYTSGNYFYDDIYVTGNNWKNIFFNDEGVFGYYVGLYYMQEDHLTSYPRHNIDFLFGGLGYLDWFSIPYSLDDKVLHIVDKTTIKIYDYAPLCYENAPYANGADVLYKFNAGSAIGTLVYYGKPTYYTYVKNDNILIISNGDIYTITSEGIIKNGSSNIKVKYNPQNIY